jgi:hypothetical protein
LVSNFINYTANSIDETTKKITKQIFSNIIVISQICKLLQKYKLICKNPEKYENFNTVNKYINNKNLLKHLNQIDVIEIEKIIHTIQETIILNKEFNELFNTNLNNTAYKFLKKNI